MVILWNRWKEMDSHCNFLWLYLGKKRGKASRKAGKCRREAAAVAIFLMGAYLEAWKRESSRGLIGYGTPLNLAVLWRSIKHAQLLRPPPFYQVLPQSKTPLRVATAAKPPTHQHVHKTRHAKAADVSGPKLRKRIVCLFTRATSILTRPLL